MAISINWKDKIINVPRADLTLIQSTPVEIRELNLNAFRLTLKDLEDDIIGMPYVDTHTHNGEVLLGGIVYARVIEIINGYTITFEDGQYSVNLVGANSNVGDVVNANQVSIRSSNAAGLISNQAIEFSSFNGGVTVDIINGVGGTTFPIGTPQQPVNNIMDAILIAELRGFYTLFINGDYTFDTGDDVSGYSIVGVSSSRSTLIFQPNSLAADVEVSKATVSGVFDITADFKDCIIINSQFVKGSITNCILQGEITLDGGGLTSIVDCKDGLVSDSIEPSINFNGSGNSLAIRNYAGDIRLFNKSGSESVEINMATGGHIKLDDTITGGDIRITGIAKVSDLTSSGATVDVTQVIFPDQLQLAAFNGQIHIDILGGVAGTKFPLGTSQNPVNNLADAIIIADSRGINEFLLTGTLVITDTDISNYIFIGENNLDAVVVLSGAGNITTKTTFRDLILVGRINGYVYVEACGLQTLSNIGSTVFPSIFRDCIVRADVGITPTLSLNNTAGGQHIHFIECVSGVPGNGTATLDFNNSDSPLAFRKYGGGITLKNITSNTDSTFEFDQGQIKIDSTCTTGMIRLGGIYKLTNNGTLTLTERNQSVTASATLDPAITTQIDELHKIQGLQTGKPAVVTKTGRVVDTLVQTFTEDVSGNVIITRT